MPRNSGRGPRKDDFSARLARDCREAHSILDELLPLAKLYSFVGVSNRCESRYKSVADYYVWR